MTVEKEKKARKMPKGGRKGGSVFPRIGLPDAVAYARKLVSKTHVSAQPVDVIYSGVVGAKSGIGNVRISALKQFGLLNGDVKSKFSAGDLAKKIAAAPEPELPALFRAAALKPTVFRRLFETFHGDVVSKSKLKQRAADLKVHPDETATCVDLYLSSMTAAGLVQVQGDQVTHMASSDLENEGGADDDTALGPPGTDSHGDTDTSDSRNDESSASGRKSDPTSTEANDRAREDRSGPRAVFNVNVSLDSSLDIEKLQKQLELLKRFGAI